MTQIAKNNGFLKFAAALTGAVIVTVAASPAAFATRVNEKVTICHRTHATTNPYRMITVSMSSIIGNGNSGNGHGGDNHNPYYTGKPVFDPTFSYPANQKQWQDIIPPFNYVPANGNAGSYAGLNWNDAGKAIYYGYTVNGTSFAGLCSKMSAKEFYDNEVASATADNPGANTGELNQIRHDALQDVKDQEAEEDGDTSNINNGNDFPTLPHTPAGPKVPPAVKELQDTLDTENNGQSSLVQAIAGVVWVDTNRDGIQQDSEQLLGNVGIELTDPTTGELYAPTSLNPTSIRAQTVTPLIVYTDSNGYFSIPSVPEGDWTVQVITPSGYTYTYDSNGSGDGQMPGTYVPSGGVGFAWAGLVLDPNTSGGGSNGGDPNTGGSTGNTSDGDLASTGPYPISVLIGSAFIMIGAGNLARKFIRRPRKH